MHAHTCVRRHACTLVPTHQLHAPRPLSQPASSLLCVCAAARTSMMLLRRVRVHTMGLNALCIIDASRRTEHGHRHRRDVEPGNETVQADSTPNARWIVVSAGDDQVLGTSTEFKLYS
eukprot:2746670-Pleurochrysis_carterae.AAC.1